MYGDGWHFIAEDIDSDFDWVDGPAMANLMVWFQVWLYPSLSGSSESVISSESASSSTDTSSESHT